LGAPVEKPIGQDNRDQENEVGRRVKKHGNLSTQSLRSLFAGRSTENSEMDQVATIR
jgi:hypothetical protein